LEEANHVDVVGSDLSHRGQLGEGTEGPRGQGQGGSAGKGRLWRKGSRKGQIEVRSASTPSYPIFLACKCVGKPRTLTTLTAVTGVPSSLRSPRSPKAPFPTIPIMRRTSAAGSSRPSVHDR